MAEPRIFGLPPGVDFPRALVEGLIARMQGQPPGAMARVRLYLNAGRMLRRVREEFDRHGARYLPRLALVTDLPRDPLAGQPPAIPDLRRKLELVPLVEAMARRIPGFESGRSAFALAESLAALMAEMQSEGVGPARFEALDIAESHAEHWRLSLQFVRIVSRYFEADSPPDAQARLRRAVQVLGRLWQDDPPGDPVIVAGSTGSRGVTAEFMQIVAGLPGGMIVLPGFDFAMPDAVWTTLGAEGMPLEDHPQYRFRALLDRIGIAPAQVQLWHETARAPDPARNALVSLALRPAPVTDQWASEGALLGDLRATCAGLTLIEADDPRQEAIALALILREAAEAGRSAALITPDRMLTRRVAAVLDRWGIVPDDSAGEPLSQSAPGRFLRHVAQAMGAQISVETLLILLKHPLSATGSALRGEHLRLTRELELSLRRFGPAFPDAQALARWAGDRGDDAVAWAAWIGRLIGLCDLSGGPLSAILETHLAICATLAAGPGGTVEASELWLQEGGRECRRLMAELAQEAPAAGVITAADFSDLLTRHLQGGTVRHGRHSHPGILFWGTLEARAQGAQLVICAGLNEGSWPEVPSPDPWLSRRMRHDLGLLLPERQIGLSAHDFQQALGAPEVILSRARRDADAASVPSRWLNRLLNLVGGLRAQGGEEALAQMRARGKHWTAMARRLEVPRMSLEHAARPSPVPPVAARPRSLSVTAVKTLIRDPYAIYARQVLRLRPLDPLRPEADPRLRGQVLHEIVQRFVQDRPEAETLPEARERLIVTAESVLQARIAWPGAQRLWLARIARIAERFVADEDARQARGTPVVIEEKGSVTLRNGFVLTGKPDRIDLLEGGMVHLFDYKSGAPPKEKEVVFFDKQLPLEKGMVQRGAFAAIGPREVARMTYIRLGGEGETRDVTGIYKPREGGSVTETSGQTWEKFELLIARYLHPDQGFTARRAMQKRDDRSDYDQLARFGEWDETDPARKERLE